MVVDAFILLVGTAVPVSRLEAMITEEEEMRVSVRFVCVYSCLCLCVSCMYVCMHACA